ncbi:MAG: class I SAM-dependent methyltransferase [Chitinophagaceae bacterium]|nr:class I SAM-dependent methyltransferase [Chitinophagaceae bacterium]
MTPTLQDKNKVNHSKYEVEQFNNEIIKYNLNNGDTLLDIGSGFGYEDATLFRFYPNMFFVLVDIDNKFSRLNKSFIVINGKTKYFKDNAKYVNGFVDSIPLLSDSYNTILCRKTVHEFDNPKKMISEIKRILRLNGTLIVEEAIPKNQNDIDPYCKKRHLSKEELVNTFSENGFSLISADTTTMAIKKKNDGNMNILKFKKNTSG